MTSLESRIVVRTFRAVAAERTSSVRPGRSRRAHRHSARRAATLRMRGVEFLFQAFAPDCVV